MLPAVRTLSRWQQHQTNWNDDQVTVNRDDLDELVNTLAALVADHRAALATISELRAALQQTVSIQRAERSESRREDMR